LFLDFQHTKARPGRVNKVFRQRVYRGDQSTAPSLIIDESWDTVYIVPYSVKGT